jgi:hypothetical protein
VARRGIQVVLARMSRLSPTAVFLAVGGLVLAGLFAPRPYGGVALLVLAAGFAALLRVTWAVGTPRTRAARVVILVLLVALAVIRL